MVVESVTAFFVAPRFMRWSVAGARSCLVKLVAAKAKPPADLGRFSEKASGLGSF
jgi:hypothetical protein